MKAGRHAALFHGLEHRLGDPGALAFGEKGLQVGIARRGLDRQRVLGRNGHVSHATERVGPRRVDAERAAAFDLEFDLETLGAPDPVGLHQLDALGPARQAVERAEQVVGIARDREVVHRDLALLDQRTGAPAATVDDLLVGEHGLVDRVPVDDARRAIGDALFEHAQEQPLVPAVVVGPARRDLARPVDAEAERPQLPLHVRDVVVGPLRGRHAVRHRGVLGRQAERVPAHGLQHIAALHAHEARQHVTDRVVAHVPHVQPPARIREHAEAVVLRAGGILRDNEAAVLIPELLGSGLEDGGLVTFLHGRPVGLGGKDCKGYWGKQGTFTYFRRYRWNLQRRWPETGGCPRYPPMSGRK